MPLRSLEKPRLWLLRMLVGAGLIALFLYSAVSWLAFEQSAVHVRGTVLEVRRETRATGWRGGRISIERPVVKFTIPGANTEIKATAKVLSRHLFVVGDELPLEFQLSDPSTSVRVEGSLSVLDLAFGVVGGAIVLFAVAEKWRYTREKRHLASRIALNSDSVPK